MTKKIFLTLITLLFVNVSFAEQLQIDLIKSKLHWTGKKIGQDHLGTVDFKSGYVEVTDGALTGGKFVLNMDSIKNEDIESDEWRAKLESHLKSDDFFNVSEFPEGTFEITQVKNGSIPGTVEILGNLKIKNIAKPVSFTAEIKQSERAYHGTAKTVIDRSKWDIKYRSKSFFDPAALGDKIIHDDIDIALDIYALMGS